MLQDTAQKMKFSITDFFSKCDQVRGKLRIWSHLLKKSVMKNFIFCAVKDNISRINFTVFLNITQYTFNSFVTFRRPRREKVIGCKCWQKLVKMSLLIASTTHILPTSQNFCCTIEITDEINQLYVLYVALIVWHQELRRARNFIVPRPLKLCNQ